MTEWALIFQIAVTGQFGWVPMPSEEDCRAKVILINSGVPMEITTPTGLKIPIGRAVDCKPRSFFERATS